MVREGAAGLCPSTEPGFRTSQAQRDSGGGVSLSVGVSGSRGGIQPRCDCVRAQGPCMYPCSVHLPVESVPGSKFRCSSQQLRALRWPEEEEFEWPIFHDSTTAGPPRAVRAASRPLSIAAEPQSEIAVLFSISEALRARRASRASAPGEQ
ncbi:hypothetical protein K466DRAFT_401436 [Polyporus arcularius HHB13444]|uniref:Uncharacterized protein n=1 Tax=Polyporus arcularius HHB13444 TaxID=1314778 RepID=A0A5C3NRN7_9APHY|nr:hypothetical protein K466DRAFT_401436 [Polyporus arcularius HHB13444]